MAHALRVSVVQAVCLEDQDPQRKRHKAPEETVQALAGAEEDHCDRESGYDAGDVRQDQQTTQDEIAVETQRNKRIRARLRSFSNYRDGSIRRPNEPALPLSRLPTSSHRR